MMPRTELAHGIATAEPLFTTTTVFGLAAATSVTNWFWSAGRLMSERSLPSDSNLLTKTIARSAALAAATAWSCPLPLGSFHCWPAPPLQVLIVSWVLLFELDAVRHLPEPVLTRVPLVAVHFCAAVLLQSYSWILVPSAVPAA